MPISRRNVLAATLGVTAASSLPSQASAPAATTPVIAALQPRVEIASGKLRGFEQTGVRAFLGIPYGAPVNGENRFMPPKPPAPWTGVRDALVYGMECPYWPTPVKDVGAPEKPEDNFLLYRSFMPHNASEDCLRLNVWSPAGGAAKKPVMVYMHGGGFIAGSGHGLLAYDGANLARRGDVVVVTHNHRLNIFGYLDLSPFGGRWANSANIGMQDNVAVLQWVRDNIAAFGGDPGNVTIFGQSGGGGKVLALLAMPSAKGLYHKAIVQSGTFPKSNSISPATAKEQTDRALAALAIAPADLDKLREVKVEQLCTVARAMLQNWRPVLDGKVITGTPGEVLPRGIPLLIGTNFNEAVNAVDNPEREGFDAAALDAAAAKAYGADSSAIVASYRQSHPGRAPFELWCAMHAEGIRSESFRTADRKADGKVWQYLFAWATPVLEGRPKTFHSAEIAFVFDNAGLCINQTGGGAEALRLSGQIADAWIAFARSGDPNHNALPPWPTFGRERPTMVFDNACELRRDLEAEGRKLIAKHMG